jgi:uncharacterized membrane protein
MNFLRMYGVGLAVCLVLDLIWLGVVAKGLYRQQIGHLLRPDVQWVPAVLFYLTYVAALVVFVAGPAAEKDSLTRAVGYGAFFGVAAYAAFDLTSLALLKDFPWTLAVIDLGRSPSAAVCGCIIRHALWS